MNLPRYYVYGDYSGNYGAHALAFEDAAGNTFWFSYTTLVAFRAANGDLTVRKNDWGPTTGKHLNAIDGGDKAKRIDGDAFKRAVVATFGALPQKV